MPENVRQQRDVFILLEKKDREQMPEGVRVQHLFTNSVQPALLFNLTADPSG